MPGWHSRLLRHDLLADYVLCLLRSTTGSAFWAQGTSLPVCRLVRCMWRNNPAAVTSRRLPLLTAAIFSASAVLFHRQLLSAMEGPWTCHGSSNAELVEALKSAHPCCVEWSVTCHLCCCSKVFQHDKHTRVSLAGAKIVTSPRIEQAMKAVDRGLFTQNLQIRPFKRRKLVSQGVKLVRLWGYALCLFKLVATCMHHLFPG